jgi:hypothetical protein
MCRILAWLLGLDICGLAGMNNERHNNEVVVAVVGPVIGIGVGDAARLKPRLVSEKDTRS